jgi:serine/threonine protein kinase
MDERTIFLEALNKVGHQERTAFLNEACGDKPDLRRRVEILLAAYEDAGSFLEKQPEEVIATVGTDGEASDNKSDEAWRELLTPSSSPCCIGMLGQYEILELVGRGGMGVVLHAHDPKLKRTVAIKLLAPELGANPMSVRRFLREAQAAAAVSHDHVVTMHAIDQEARPPFIVMEYVAGQSLQQKIDALGALDVKSILRIGMQTAAGLAAAHRQGLVHRDVKPSNVLLENGIERVKLSDFGLARAVDDVDLTRTGQITGTPQYMSPEQAQSQRVDHRTDLFSLGCVLYAMSTGRAAFRADSAVAAMHRVIHDSPKPIRLVNPEIPDWLCEIVYKLLEKNPDDRFQSSEEVADLLGRHLAHLQQPESIPRPERIGPSPSMRRANTTRESSDSFPPSATLRRRATGLITVIAGLDVLLCLALFFGIAPVADGRAIPDPLAIASVLGGVIGVVLLLITLFGRRDPIDGALQKPVGLRAGCLALLPICPVHILAIPASIWIVRVFLRSQEGVHISTDTSGGQRESQTKWAGNWPALYLGVVALALVLLSLDRDSGVVTRSWLNVTSHGMITLHVRDGGVRVTINGADQAVTRDGPAQVVVVPGAYVIRSRNGGKSMATYLHQIRRGSRITQKIDDRATDVAIIGPVSTERLDQKARTELLKKYSQPDLPAAGTASGR